MPIEKSEWIWMSGRWVKWEQATVHVTAHALHYGSSAFEGIRAYEGEEGPGIFRLDRHLERLLDSCKLLRFDMGSWDLDTLTQVTIELVARNQHKSCYIRPIAFRGSENMGVYPLTCPVELAIFSFPWGRYLGPEAIEQGVDVARELVAPLRAGHLGAARQDRRPVRHQPVRRGRGAPARIRRGHHARLVRLRERGRRREPVPGAPRRDHHHAALVLDPRGRDARQRDRDRARPRLHRAASRT